jgi:hypothetical protein
MALQCPMKVMLNRPTLDSIFQVNSQCHRYIHSLYIQATEARACKTWASCLLHVVLRPQPCRLALFSGLSSTLTSLISSLLLNTNEERNKDDIVFAPYGAILKDKGFLCLSQLTLDIFTLED